MVKQEPWVSVDEVVRQLSVANDTVYPWIETKGIPAHRLSRLWKFKRDEVVGLVRHGRAGR